MADNNEELDQEMIDAAIAAGEAAAAEDMKKDAEKLTAERTELAQKVTELEEELETAKKEAADAKDRVARLQADWDNYRRRTAQERVAERARATEGLVEDLLPVIDDLEHAIAHIKQTDTGHEQQTDIAEGVEAVYNKLLETLARQGVEQIDPKDQAFDPAEAQAVSVVPFDEVYDETVMEVFRKGYRMGGRVVRPAMVVVSTGGPKRPVEEKDEPAAE
jgi:molecular chaperone GrpE